jgi:DNA-binding transcriptional LysR family regulator
MLLKARQVEGPAAVRAVSTVAADPNRRSGEALRAPEFHTRLLRYFIAAAEDENFNRAAERLNLDQSALSRRIRDLEEELGVALFERCNKRVRLSAAGRAFLDEARAVSLRLAEAAARCRRLARAEANTLRIGINDSALRHDKLSRALRTFHGAFPDVDLQVRPTTPLTLLEAVLNGVVDGAFIYTRPETCDEINHIEVAKDCFLIAMPAEHRLASAPRIRLRDLRGEEFLWMTRESAPAVNDRMMQSCRDRGLDPRISQYLLSESSRLHLVAEGMGITFVTGSFADFLPARVAVREVEDFSFELPLDFVWRRDNSSSIVARFVEIVAGLSDPKGKALPHECV